MDKFIIAGTGKWNKELYISKNFHFRSRFKFVESPKELRMTLRSHKPKYIFFIHWRWIVPKSIIIKYECICFHMTDLPYGRGGSPLQNLILRKHKYTKLSVIKMTDKIDAGPIYYKRVLSLNGSARQIYVRCSKLSIKLIEKIIKNNPSPVEQKGKIVQFKRRQPNQSKIPKNLSLSDIYDYIRMLDAPGYPKAYINIGKNKVELFDAKFNNGTLKFKGSIKSK